MLVSALAIIQVQRQNALVVTTGYMIYVSVDFI